MFCLLNIFIIKYASFVQKHNNCSMRDLLDNTKLQSVVAWDRSEKVKETSSVVGELGQLYTNRSHNKRAVK